MWYSSVLQVTYHFHGGPGFLLEKRNCIIGKMKSKYWVQMHKFSVKIAKSLQEVKAFDEENENTLRWDAI